MKIFDPERWIFTLTSLSIAAVFVLLTPSTAIIARWFPGKTDRLWLYPGFLFFLSFVLWFFYRLSLPKLIQKGIFEDRRKNRGALPERRLPEKVWLWLRPMLRLLTHVFFIAGICSSLLTLMRSGKNKDLLEAIARDPVYDRQARQHKKW